MLTKTAIEYFSPNRGARLRIAHALKLTSGAISQWGDVVPEGQAYKLQALTDGALQVDPSCYEKTPVDTAS